MHSFLIFLLASCGQKKTEPNDAKNTLETVRENGYFTLGLDDAFPPMGYTDEAGNIVGFDIDLAEAVASEMGLEVKKQPLIWDNIEMEIKNRNVDMIWNGCAITPEREAIFDFSKPYFKNSQILVISKNSLLQSRDDMKGKKLGIQEGSSANIVLDENVEFKDQLGEVVGYESNDKALMDLDFGRIDAVLVDISVFAHYNNIKPDTYRELKNGDLGGTKNGIAFHKEADSFREEVQKAMDTIIQNGTAAEISQKWFGRDGIVKE